MTPEQLDQIITESAGDIRERLGELAPKIRDAAAAKLEETQKGDKSAVLSVALALKIDLAMSPPTWKVVAKVGATYTSEGDEHVTDDQPDLGLDVAKGRRPQP